MRFRLGRRATGRRTPREFPWWFASDCEGLRNLARRAARGHGGGQLGHVAKEAVVIGMESRAKGKIVDEMEPLGGERASSGPQEVRVGG